MSIGEQKESSLQSVAALVLGLLPRLLPLGEPLVGGGVADRLGTRVTSFFFFEEDAACNTLTAR